MTGRLAIFTAQLGTVTETFIRRHVQDLLPKRTVVIARSSTHPMDGQWRVDCPLLFLDRFAAAMPARLARRAGWPEQRLYDRAVSSFLRQHDVKLALVEYLHLFADFVPLLDRMAIPYVVQGHGLDLSAAMRDPHTVKRYRVYKSARAVLTRSELHRQRLIDIGLPADKVHVNPGGVDLPSTLPDRDETAGRCFLAIGRMTGKKGPLQLLEAFGLAAARNPELTLDYVGTGPFYPLACRYVNERYLHARVRLHGAASDQVKERLFERCGVFVQHSITDPDTGDEEGLPASIQEAMAHGLAVVSTRHSGIADAVEEGVAGLLVDEGDTRAMADAMLKVSDEPKLSARMGAAGRRKAERFYTWPAERARLLGHLRVHAD